MGIPRHKVLCLPSIAIGQVAKAPAPVIEAAVRDAREVLVHPRTNHTEGLGPNGGENRCADFPSSRQMGAVRGSLFGRPVPPSIQPGKKKA